MNEHEIVGKLEAAVNSVVRGQAAVVRKVLACLVSGGHILLEDCPGTGKTTIAKAISRAIDGADFKRVQFTPDLLPSDILGISIYDPRSTKFRFHSGPVFTDILLADEINRASPRTQSALLEAMGERQATIEGKRYELDGMFFVIATQNPVEFRGTYPLPEAQMDRFMMQCTLGYVNTDEERSILASQMIGHPIEKLESVVNRDQVIELHKAAQQVRFSDELRHYVVSLVAATREHEAIQLAASPRASLALMKVSQAMAIFEDMEFVTPELVQSVAVDVIAHRLVLAPEARYAGSSARQIVHEIIDAIPVPV